jgi:DNA-binding response OmpR family regulator
MNGVQLCQKLADSGCRLPFILITAHLDEETRILARESNSVAVLFKPFARDALVSAISTALRGQGCL